MYNNAIEIYKLNKIYKSKNGQKHAVKDIDLNIKRGSFFGLLGPNGAGKSTIIDIIAGSVVKTSGSIKICNIDYDKEFIKSRYKIGVVPQELLLDTFFTVRELLEQYAGYYGISNSNEKIEELLNKLDLKSKENSPTTTLSGGMKRRLLVAKALVHSPEVVILDEPTAGVDIELRQALWDYISYLNKEQGVTVIITTHYLEEADFLCDTLAIINDGQIVALDSKSNLIEKHTLKKFVIKTPDLKEIPGALKNFTYTYQDGILNLIAPASANNAEIVKLIFTCIDRIESLEIVKPSLEEAFKKLT